MLRCLTFYFLLFSGLQLSAWQEQKELVFTATSLTEKAELFLNQGAYDSALVLCDQAIEKAVSYREAYIVKHKIYEAMEAKSAPRIENLKAAQKISLEDEELAYYLGQVYQKRLQFEEAIVAYTDAIEFSKGHDGDMSFRYFYYFGRGTSYVKNRQFNEAIPDFSKALEINPESVGALINRGFCFYNTKEKEKACDDWRAASKRGNKTASGYIGKYCF